ncbi:MAG: hypothetical protein ACRD9S_12695 [Pyrinomonadaceae bacterium]
MKILWYLLTAFLGLVGVMALLRTVERLAVGAGLLPVQLIIAVVMLLLAALCLRKARSSA